jgi:mannose-6-phosphate isomerase-like protein (cupin superfamily)
MDFEQMHMVNVRRDAAMIEHFKRNIGRKVFILTEAFPFMYIGIIKDVVDDMAVLDVQTSHVPALEGREWHVHVHSIDVFYIETGMGEKIPDLKNEQKGG